MLGTKTKLAALLILVTFINFFFFHIIGNFGFVLLSSGFFAFILYLFRKSEKVTFLEICLFTGLSLILLFRSSFLIIFFSVALEALLFSTHIYESIFEEDLYDSYDRLFLHPIFLAFQYLKSSLDLFILKKIGLSKLTPKRDLVVSIIRGVLIAAPILLVLIVLLTSADPIYSKFLRDLFYLKIDFANQVLQRVILSLLFFVVLLPLAFLEKVKSANTSPVNMKMFALSKEMIVVSSLIAITLGSFLFIQFKYIFASVPAESELIKFGINTYSEYVRRGFIELALASFLIYKVSKIGLEVVKGSEESVRNLLTKVQVFGLFELVIFIFSIVRRVWLYQSYHGLSVVRIYGLIFLSWILAMTLLLILEHFRKGNFIRKEVAVSVIFVFILGFANVENFVATSSEPPTVNGNVDYVYLSRLSDEGARGWLRSYDYAKSVLIDKNLASKSLINREGRREVAYAGYITSNLTNNYHHLIMSYGDNKTLNAYLLKILSFDNFIIRPDESSQFTEIKKHLAENNGQKQEFHFRLETYGMRPIFTGVKNSHSLFYFAYLDPNITLSFPTNLDRLFIWNYSSFKAWGLIRDEIGLENLLLLQKSYENLANKISAQPESERGYDFDISLSSPLID